ncbi:hypothetical protein AcV7_005395 [Taiwanofungus camphoratus]|nr:hypothetical protein AcV7_005395 [Antrodia cinnamomea]
MPLIRHQMGICGAGMQPNPERYTLSMELDLNMFCQVQNQNLPYCDIVSTELSTEFSVIYGEMDTGCNRDFVMRFMSHFVIAVCQVCVLTSLPCVMYTPAALTMLSAFSDQLQSYSGNFCC